MFWCLFCVCSGLCRCLCSCRCLRLSRSLCSRCSLCLSELVFAFLFRRCLCSGSSLCIVCVGVCVLGSLCSGSRCVCSCI